MPQIPNQNNNIWGGNNDYPQQNVVNVNGNINANVDNNFISKVALVLAILSFMCCCIDFLFSIPAVICAIIALIKNKKDITAWAAIIIASLSLIVYIFAAISGALTDLVDSLPAERGNNKVSTSYTDNNSTNNETKLSNTEKSNDVIDNKIDYEIIDTTFYTYEDSIGGNNFYFSAEIKNTGNCNLYLGICKLDLEDASGHLLQTSDEVLRCQDVIRPGETGYYFNIFGDINKDINVDDIERCNSTFDIQKTTHEPINYNVSDTSIIEDNTLSIAKCIGRITNNTDKYASIIDIYIIFYDNNGKVIGATLDNIVGLASGETQSFETSTYFMSGNISFDDIADYKVIAHDAYIQW